MTSPAGLYACLYAKEFPAQAMLRLRPALREKPCVVMEGVPPLQKVCSLNAKAHTMGVARCMTKVEIDTFASLAVLQRSQTEERAAMTAMLECAGSFSPRVEDRSNDNAFLCVIDIAGTKNRLGLPLFWVRPTYFPQGRCSVLSSYAAVTFGAQLFSSKLKNNFGPSIFCSKCR